MNWQRNDFPADFQFGVATSAYQIEGHQFGQAGLTHWDTFAATPGKVKNMENGAIACDHYHRYPQDIKLIKEANFDSYRFSASWARVLPEGKGKVNQKGLDFYDRLTDELCDHNIKPHLTLYHWELPAALADLGGWRNRDIAMWFGDYTQLLLERIGDRMHSIAPINEPWCVSWLSHMLGHHAPGLKDIRAAAHAMHHVLLAHGQAIQVMRSMGLSNLGMIANLEWAHPYEQSEAAIASAQLYDDYYNNFFLSGVFNGCYPESLTQDSALGPHLPKHWQDDLALISQPVDWCGLNYYTSKLIKPNQGPWPSHDDVPGQLPKTQMGWDIYPQGLHDFLLRTQRKFTGNLPIFITENGMANADQITATGINDQIRIDYINSHLQACQQAIDAGVPIAGYFVWSLLDNYEWSLGYEKRFGIVHVDFDSLERTPKASYYALQKALVLSEANKVSGVSRTKRQS